MKLAYKDFNVQIANMRSEIVNAIGKVLDKLPEQLIDFTEGAPCVEDDDVFEIDGLNDCETLIEVNASGVSTVDNEYGFFDLGTDDLINLYDAVYTMGKRILEANSK